MRKLTVFEFTIIGFFIAIIVSTYLMYITSMDVKLGTLLSNISLIPLLKYIKIPDNIMWISSFFIYIVVYTIYSLILALITRYLEKTRIVVAILVIALIAVVTLDQVSSQKKYNEMKILQDSQVASVVAIPKIVKQYFGNEVRGDLNADGREDVAFIITRKDDDRGILYYLTSAISSTTGNFGTNLVFLGNNTEPRSIGISDGSIDIEYFDRSMKKSTTTKYLHAKIVEGELKLIDSKNGDSVASTTAN